MAEERDWLKVVYRGGIEPAGRRPAAAHMEIAVRQTPSEIDLSGGVERRVRVTVVPSEPGLRWRLFLRDFDRGPGDAARHRIWWRLDPGTWQPLGGTRTCVAEGRGRVRLDVCLRQDQRAGEPEVETARPRLRFVAESARG